MGFNLTVWEETAAAILAENERRRDAGMSSELTLKSLHPASARLVYNAALATRAKRILEVGTSAGYSTLWLGRAAMENSAMVLSLEVKPDFAEMARENVKSAGLAEYVSIETCDAVEFLPSVCGEAKFDFVFLDAEKTEYLAYFDLIWPHVDTRGSVFADNVISHSEALAGYLKHVRDLADAATDTVKIGNGLEWTVKI
ncbi:MAG: class I SAM-dependent methyltransferase [Candidatus Coatesbacteria bacterium]|nr:MAG: class I SAM-dependent methyltransferase [Candidatus Coatesbacteria bacterium]